MILTHERENQMNHRLTFRLGLATMLAAAAMCIAGAPATAQGFGGGQIPPEIAAKIKLWKKYTEDHKKATNLSQTVVKIEGMNREDEYKLDKKQAGKMLAIMKTWSPKPSVSEDEAGTVMKDINSFLTTKQIKKMTTMPNPFARAGAGGGRPGGAGGPGGGRPGGAGGGPMNFPAPPKTGINPFNLSSMSGPFRERATKNMDDFKAQLETQVH